MDLSGIEREHARAVAAVTEAEAKLRRAEASAERARARVTEARAEAARLHQALALLRGEASAARPRSTRAQPHEGNLMAALSVVRDRRSVTVAEVTRALGSQSARVKGWLEVLEKRGLVRFTGEHAGPGRWPSPIVEPTNVIEYRTRGAA